MARSNVASKTPVEYKAIVSVVSPARAVSDAKLAGLWAGRVHGEPREVEFSSPDYFKLSGWLRSYMSMSAAEADTFINQPQ